MGTREFLFLLGTLFFCQCSAQYEGEGGYESKQEEPYGEPHEPASDPYAAVDSYSSKSSKYSSSSSSKMGETFSASDIEKLDVEGGAVNDPGMDATSKACRYDEGVGWSDCDPFELIKFRVLRLVHGGSQCEEMKNITKHCTPHDFPYGTHWLIQEHRKCISELNRLKAMIADLHKFIEVMQKKGKELFAAYVQLKAKLSELTERLDKLKVEGIHQQQVLERLKAEIEEWKAKARELQVELDELRSKFHDLQAEEHEVSLRNEQLTSEINVIVKENEGLKMKIDQLTRDNEELKKRIVESERTQEQVADLKVKRDKLSEKLDGLTETLQMTEDKLAEAKIAILAKKLEHDKEAQITKDTHVDLNLEMFITHNKTVSKEPPHPVYYTTEKYYKDEHPEEGGKCLISYYGTTNETCWYESEGEESEDAYVDALGHHLVEAHWKYFTIDAKDQAECDKAAHLHYEFLLNRCQPKHYLPVLAIFRPSSEEKELSSHIYPKVQSHGPNACWITFLGAHGHCEAHSDKYDLYNTPDNEDPNSYKSKETCLARAEWWMKYCDTPVVVTYVPEDVSTNWHEDWIMHDSHGGKMFEDTYNTKDKINPDSLKPHTVDASKYASEYKSMPPKSPDYHDSPEYRKSLHLQGHEKEEMLASLRKRLGMSGPAGRVSGDVKQHLGVDTNAEKGDESSMSSYGMSSGSSYSMSSGSSSSSMSSDMASSSYSQSSYGTNQEEQPKEIPYEEKPAENPYEEKPAENPYEEKPAENPYEEKPAEKIYETPAETPYEEKPAEKPYEEKPEENTYEEKPAENPYEEKPAENPYEEKPAENPYEEKPAENPYEEKPAENPYEEKKEENPYEEKDEGEDNEEEPYGDDMDGDDDEEDDDGEEPYGDAPKYDEPGKDESAEKYK